ncbi:hypothetical protein CKM354_000728300 [Cercospora kikuchii]|uniref:Uncharacterized protein n=1 Tax=Cercospora kikuchii TaxID=84275 RepID=A0A9P3CJN8_9PEZI|nr:uncharacterized protein CKM354_000728300 [Cercospora kikuchii]GIZ44074.1 hypothetical protein CKM354_000728300 [Cercospora kikuchii]
MTSHRNFGDPAQAWKRVRVGDDNEIIPVPKKQKLPAIGQIELLEQLYDELQHGIWELQAQKIAPAARPDPGLYQLPPTHPKLALVNRPQQDFLGRRANPDYVDAQTQTEWLDRKQAGRPKFIEQLLADQKARRLEERFRLRDEMVASFTAQEAELDRQHEEAINALESKHTVRLNALNAKLERARDDLEDDHLKASLALDKKEEEAVNAFDRDSSLLGLVND